MGLTEATLNLAILSLPPKPRVQCLLFVNRPLDYGNARQLLLFLYGTDWFKESEHFLLNFLPDYDHIPQGITRDGIWAETSDGEYLYLGDRIGA